MEIKLVSQKLTDVKTDWLVVGIAAPPEISDTISELDAALGGRITRLIEAKDISGKLAERLTIFDAEGIASGRLLIVGLGKSDELTQSRLNKAIASAARQISEKKEVSIAVALSAATDTLDAAAIAETTTTAIVVSTQGQGLYQNEPTRHAFSTTMIVGDDSETTKAAVEKGTILGEAINLTRELVNRPAGEIYPETFAAKAEKVAQQTGLKCEVLDENQLATEKMNSLLAVAQGSDRPARVAILEHRGSDANDPPLALIGKGVTFDSGGLSLKPGDGMKDMKCDMAGAATVLGAMSAIARLNLPVNVVGYMGLVENMVSGNSYKLGDVLTARNGLTIEVLNTDAEGRLVLADVLALAVDRGANRLVDAATLTGACVVALGSEVVGAFTNNQEWCNTLVEAAKNCDERVWQMPMDDDFGELLKSDVADCRNVGPRWGGAITAAKFLEKFVSDTPWVHLDIAGPAFAESNKPHREGGGTGVMVATMVELASG